MRRILPYFLCIFIVACATPQTPRQVVATAEASFTAAVQAATAAARAGVLKKGSSTEILVTKAVTVGNNALDAAQAAVQADAKISVDGYIQILTVVTADILRLVAEAEKGN